MKRERRTCHVCGALCIPKLTAAGPECEACFEPGTFPAHAGSTSANVRDPLFAGIWNFAMFGVASAVAWSAAASDPEYVALLPALCLALFVGLPIVIWRTGQGRIVGVRVFTKRLRFRGGKLELFSPWTE